MYLTSLQAAVNVLMQACSFFCLDFQLCIYLDYVSTKIRQKKKI